MKAIICKEYGPIENLVYGEMDDPKPGSRNVILKAEAIGVNFPDGLLVQGLYQAKPPTPFVPGMELVGTIIEMGDKVEGFKIGDRVGAMAMIGAFAERLAYLRRI
ncbi:MAG: alcohol dehydrogenase catalytic domain-containing protein [Salaquimonas sp.]